MVVPFGVSVGDFIAVAKLASDVVSELKKDSEAASHYQNLIVELETLGTALSRISEIKPTEHGLVHLDAIRAATLACKRPLDDFLSRLQKYEGTMGVWNAKEKRFEGFAKRVQYGFTLEGEVKDLRATLANHIATINMLLLAQTLISIAAAETDRADLAKVVSRSALLLKQVNDSQAEISTDVKTQKKAMESLQDAVDKTKEISMETNERQNETNAALKTGEEALDDLREAVQQSKEVNEELRLEMSKSNPHLLFAKAVTIQNPQPGSPKSEPKEEKELEALQEETRSMRIELKRLQIQAKYPDLYSSTVANRVQALGRSPFLETTSKVLNLVLSGVMAATAWTLMNQSQEIAELSKQLLASCAPNNATMILPESASYVPSVLQRSGLPVAGEDPESSDEEITISRRDSDPRGKKPLDPIKPPRIPSENSAPTSFIVRFEDLDPEIESQSSHPPRWYPPRSNHDLCLGPPTFFRWSKGHMELIPPIEVPPPSFSPPIEQHSVATVFCLSPSREIRATDFDAGRYQFRRRRSDPSMFSSYRPSHRPDERSANRPTDADDAGSSTRNNQAEKPTHQWKHIGFVPKQVLAVVDGETRNNLNNKDDQDPSSETSPRKYYTSVQFEGPACAAAPLPRDIVPQLLPKIYNRPKLAPSWLPNQSLYGPPRSNLSGGRRRENAGLIGRLPLLLALAALSAPKMELGAVMERCVRPGRWEGSEWVYYGGAGYHRGIVVTIFYDPHNPEGSTEEALERIEEGRDGPFYGPGPGVDGDEGVGRRVVGAGIGLKRRRGDSEGTAI